MDELIYREITMRIVCNGLVFGYIKGLQVAAGGGHTYCAANNPAQWVPGSLIKPVQKLVETIGGKVVC